MVEYLKNEYDVVTLPFDWRMPLADSAALLNDKDRKISSVKSSHKNNRPFHGRCCYP